MGHPDWQAYANWRGPIIAAVAGFNLSAANPFHTEAVITNFATLFLNVGQPGAAGCQAKVTFYTDSTKTVTVTSSTWTLNTNCDLRCQIPALGNYMALDVTSSSVAAFPVTIFCLPSNLPVGSTRYTPALASVTGTAVSIPASGTRTDYLPHIAEGPVYAFMKDRVASGKLDFRVYLVNADATINDRLFAADGPITVITANLLGAKNGLATQIVNNDAVNAHTADFALIADGR